MKKLIAILSTLLIAGSLFAADATTNDFVIKAQVEGKLYHGFSLTQVSGSDAVIDLLKDSTGNVVKDGINLESNSAQTIGYYNLYTTENAQASVDFAVLPLTYTTGDDTYYVPFALSYKTVDGNKQVTLGEGSIGHVAVASTEEMAGSKGRVMDTNEKSTGLRWNILELDVTFAGEKNATFGLPEAQGENYYTSTIVATISSN